MTRTDNVGLGLFDDTASAAGNFPGALRGYDRAAVDDYVRTLEASVVQSRNHAADLEKQVTGLQDQLNEAKSRETDPNDVDYAGLGGRANEILRLAQEQATDLTAAATLDGERIREEARRDAEHQRGQAQTDADELRTGGLTEIEALRTRLQDEVRGQLERAQAESAALLDAARREGASLRLQAEHDTSALRETARLETETLRREVDREVADARADVAREREDGLARARGEHEELTARTRALLAEAADHHGQSTGRLEADIAESARLRAEATAEAEQVRGNAIAEAESHVATARKQAAAITARTQQEFSWRKQQLRRETELLQQRKQAVLSQLASLSDLAQQTASSFPDLDEGRRGDEASSGGDVDVDVASDGDDHTVLKRSTAPAMPTAPAESDAGVTQDDPTSEPSTSTTEVTSDIAGPESSTVDETTKSPEAPIPGDETTGDETTEDDIPMDGEPTLLAMPAKKSPLR